MTHFQRFGGTKNGTSGARIKILRPLFNTNTPTKTPHLFYFYLVGPLSALDRGYPKFMLQYKSRDFVHTLRGVSALDCSPHILVTNGLGQSQSRRSPRPLSSSHTGTPGSWSPSQRSDQWRQVLDHPFLAHQVLLKENCPMLL